MPDQKSRFSVAWLVLYVLLSLIVISSIIIEDAAWGMIYFVLFTFTLFIFLFSWIRDTKKGAEFMLFSPNNNQTFFAAQVAVGLLLGFILVDSLLTSQPLFAFLQPLAAPRISVPLGILGVIGAIPQIFIMSIVVAEIEETFRASALKPTIWEWTGTPQLRTTLLMVLAVIIYALFEPFRFFGAMLFAFALIASIANWTWFNNFFKNENVRHFAAIAAAAIVFGLLHLKLAGDVATTSLMVNAFLFAVIADTINWKFQSTVSSKIAHCMNNAVVMCASVGAATGFGLAMTGVYALILWQIQKPQK